MPAGRQKPAPGDPMLTHSHRAEKPEVITQKWYVSLLMKNTFAVARMEWKHYCGLTVLLQDLTLSFSNPNLGLRGFSSSFSLKLGIGLSIRKHHRKVTDEDLTPRFFSYHTIANQCQNPAHSFTSSRLASTSANRSSRDCCMMIVSEMAVTTLV